MRAIALLANTAYRVQRTFVRDTLLYLQFEQDYIFRIGHDQGGVSIAEGKGLMFNNANTLQLPFPLNWQGELWYMADANNAFFEWEIATETSQRRDMVT